MAFDFLVDSVRKQRAYPALARWQARPYTKDWWRFGEHWPYTVPLRLEEYCQTHGVSIRYHTVADTLPENVFYPVALGFFDFSIDYMALLPEPVKKLLIERRIKLLFMYHEGDNVRRIRNRLDLLASQHSIDTALIKIVSANSSADSIPGAMCFHDFELWYHQRNRNVDCARVHLDVRPHEFLVMNRLHKPWRQAVMSMLYAQGALDRSLWSYCEPAVGRDFNDCPIEVDLLADFSTAVTVFSQHTPRLIDDLDDSQRNDHSVTDITMYENCYCNIVVESQFDVDQSGGCFLTEKTFKPIKHGQLFFIAGAANSLAALRDLGYDTFDDLFDNSYDCIPDATERLRHLQRSIKEAQHRGLHRLYVLAQARLLRNQRLFCAAPKLRLNTLERKLQTI